MDISPLSVHFLCVNVDPSFITYFFATTEPLNLSIENCRTVDEARQKISSFTYDAYIIDLNVSEPAALQLAREIRQKVGQKALIALISTTYADDKQISAFKSTEGIDYVLQKPIYPQQIDLLLTDLFKRHSTSSVVSRKARLQELKREYQKTIVDKIELLTTLSKSLQQNPNQANLLEFKQMVHKIAGSAGSYGYSSISSLCKELDAQIEEKLAANVSLNSEWLSSLDGFIHQVKQDFKSSALQEPRSHIAHVFAPYPQVFVIDHDVKFLGLLERVKDSFSIQLFVEPNPEKAVERLQSDNFNPNALIIAQSFPDSSLTAFDIIESQRLKSHLQPTIYALILEQNNIDARVEAMQKGIDFIFHKPVYAYGLLKAMKDALEVRSLNQFRVLTLDDDEDFCNFINGMLSEIGVTARAITHPESLFKTLEEYKPQLLLLDVDLPKYNGIKLLKALKQDIAYHDLIIVIVTASRETSTTLNVYSAKADDILYKPLDPVVLQKRILYLAERHALSKELGNTGLANLRGLMAKIHKCLIMPGSHCQYLALFEIAHFSNWIAEKGHAAANDLMVFINNQLQWEMNHTMQCFSYNASKFAIIFDGQDIHTVETKMDNFLSTLAQQKARENISFNCCVLPISKSFGTAQQLIHEAEQGLVEARSKEAAPVKIIAVLPRGEAISKKEVMLIDPDKELLRILKTAFEAHGISVKTYHEGGDALKELFERDERAFPALIIAERKLPDMDGSDLFNKLKARFQSPPPFYFLTVFSADKDVSNGLTQGALEYIGKPFNISILMQKALKTIFHS